MFGFYYFTSSFGGCANRGNWVQNRCKAVLSMRDTLHRMSDPNAMLEFASFIFASDVSSDDRIPMRNASVKRGRIPAKAISSKRPDS